MVKTQTSPLQTILNDVENAFNAKLVYVAIQLSLLLPDICSSLETKSDSRERFKIEERYIRWCKKYFEPKFKMFTANDCWALRGGVVHNGMLFGHPKSRYDRVLFGLPSRTLIHEGIFENNGGIQEKALMLDSKVFCEKMILAAHEWIAAEAENEIVLKNLPNLVRLRQEGLSPHVVGIAVIA